MSEQHIRAIDSCLDRLILEANVRMAMLLDRSGQLVTSRGEERLDVDALGALLAGNFASAREIARLIGEDSFAAVFQQGRLQHVFTALVTESWMLSLVFDARTPVGLVKVLCRRAAKELEEIFHVVCRPSESAADSLLGQSFRVLAQRTIDQLLRDAG